METTIYLDYLNAEKLAKLYLTLKAIGLDAAAGDVNQAGLVNCGDKDWDEELTRQS